MPSDFVQRKRRSRDGTADGSVQDESAIFDANVFKAGLLFDFDIDAQDLKPKHTAFLDESISFMVDRLPERLKSIQPGQKHVFVWSIDGFASHTGSAEHNLILSDLREQAVEGYLQTHAPIGLTVTTQPDQPAHVLINRKFHGFQQATHAGENKFERSVRLVIHRPGIIPPPKPLPKSGSTRFKVRLLGVLSAGKFGLQHDDAAFEIVDLENNRSGIFQFVGVGVAVPVILPFPFLSATLAGPFGGVVFTTKPVQLFDFVGQAEFTQAPSIGTKSLGPNHLKIQSQSFLNKRAHISSGSIAVPSGTIVGATIFSQTLGVLALHSEGPAS